MRLVAKFQDTLSKNSEDINNFPITYDDLYITLRHMLSLTVSNKPK